jgi:hypothetical protein
MDKFTSIGQYRNVVKTIVGHFQKIQSPHLIPTLSFMGTVKLHGTNAGVRRFHGKFQPQSRENILSVDADNYGFARFIEEIPKDDLNALFDEFSDHPDGDITLYGEWIGKGIQDTVAISELPEKEWVLFKAKVNGEYVDLHDYNVFDVKNRIRNIYEIPFYRITIDFKHPEQAIPEIEKLTLDVEHECPWGKARGISGIGEGIVWSCVERPRDSDLFFKTKGGAHSKTKVKKVATIDIERVNNINALIDVVLTNGRLEQGIDVLVNQMKLDLDPVNDVMKEEMDTITENGFEWKDLAKQVTNRTREFFFAKMNEF